MDKENKQIKPESASEAVESADEMYPECDPSGELNEAFFTESCSGTNGDAFYQAETAEFVPDSVGVPFLSFLSPGTFLSVKGKMCAGLALNLALALSLIAGPLFCVATGLFPIPIYGVILLLIIASWAFGIVHGFMNPPAPTIKVVTWAHAGLAFLSFWLPFTLCFYLSTSAIYQRTWLGGDMMQPEMLRGDVVLVNRLAFLRQKPNYGDLVLIEENVNENEKLHRRTLFGRVIARPGDTVQLFGYRPIVNGKTLAQYHAKADEDVFDSAVMTYELPSNIEMPESPSTEPSGWYPVLATNQPLFTHTNMVKLEPGFYYVLEDNRDTKRERNRSVYGYIVEESEIHGRPQYVIYNDLIEDPLSRYGIALR